MRIVLTAAGALVAFGGCAALLHGVIRWSRWRELPGELLPWWQQLPFAWTRIRLEPYDHDTQREQLGTMGEIVAGLMAIGLGCLFAWVVATQDVGVGWR